MAPKLTERQAEVLEMVKSYIAENGYPPSRMDIAFIMGFRSPNAVQCHLERLAAKGAIEMIPGVARGIRIPQ